MLVAPTDLRFTVPPPLPPIDGRYPYFDRLATHPNRLASYSLRDMPQLLKYMDQKNPAIKPWDVTYDPTHDADPRRQDAAKVVIPAGVVSLPNNVRVPIPSHAPASLFVTWDVWYGREFAFARTGIGHYKAFQFASPKARFWTQINAWWKEAPPGSIAASNVRYNGAQASGEWGPTVTNNNPLSPYSKAWIAAETWTRYFAFFRPTGERTTVEGATGPVQWWAFSLWIADQVRGVVQQIREIYIVPNYARGADGWESFWLEFNSSTEQPLATCPARVSYVRNIAMLKGLQPDQIPALLERP